MTIITVALSSLLCSSYLVLTGQRNQKHSQIHRTCTKIIHQHNTEHKSLIVTDDPEPVN